MRMRSSFLPLALMVTGCATAAVNNQGSPDASGSSTPDANGSRTPDAGGSQTSDASTVSGQDAQPAGSCASPMTGVLGTWSFSSEPGNQAATPVASSASGLTASDVQRSQTITATSHAASMSASNWAVSSSRDMTRYFSVTVTPSPGCTLDITSLAIDVAASATGPASADVATSADAFGQPKTISTTAATTASLSVMQASGAVEVRIYGYKATGASGTMRLQNTLTVSGAIH